MSGMDIFFFARLDQFVIRIFTYNLVETIARLAPRCLLHLNQRFLHERICQTKSIVITHCLCGFQCPTALEYREPAEKYTLGFRKQIMASIDQRL